MQSFQGTCLNRRNQRNCWIVKFSRTRTIQQTSAIEYYYFFFLKICSRLNMMLKRAYAIEPALCSSVGRILWKAFKWMWLSSSLNFSLCIRFLCIHWVFVVTRKKNHDWIHHLDICSSDWLQSKACFFGAFSLFWSN